MAAAVWLCAAGMSVALAEDPPLPDLSGDWTSLDFGKVTIKQDGDQLMLQPATPRQFKGRLTGRAFDLRHPLALNEIKRRDRAGNVIPDDIRQQLVGKDTRFRGRVRPDGLSLRGTYVDYDVAWKKTGNDYQITGQREAASDPVTLWKERDCIPRDQAVAIELKLAKATYARSREVASLLRTEDVANHKRSASTAYWFAFLYQIITQKEIDKHATLEQPGFLLHFIPIFYDLYDQNREAWFSATDDVTGMWKAHFAHAEANIYDSTQAEIRADYVGVNVGMGVSAHIEGDMAVALEEAYRSYRRKYCNVPPFATFHADFFDNNMPIFVDVKNEFLLYFGQLELRLGGGGQPGPVPPEQIPKILDTVGQYLGKGLEVDKIYGWRQAAWDRARAAIARSEGEAR
jgi:hypothetical protein